MSLRKPVFWQKLYAGTKHVNNVYKKGDVFQVDNVERRYTMFHPQCFILVAGNVILPLVIKNYDFCICHPIT